MAKQETIIPRAWRTWRAIKATDPRRLTKLVEVGIKLRDLRKDLEAKAGAVGSEETALKDFLIENFKDADLTEVRTKAGVARLATKTIPTIIGEGEEKEKNWHVFFAHVQKTGEFDLLQRRLHEKACAERWKNKHQIPGVKPFIKKDLKLGDAE